MKYKILEECIQLVFAAGTFLLARWILELSSPREDWEKVKRWPIWDWIVHPDIVYHRVRAWFILYRAFS